MRAQDFDAGAGDANFPSEIDHESVESRRLSAEGSASDVTETHDAGESGVNGTESTGGILSPLVPLDDVSREELSPSEVQALIQTIIANPQAAPAHAAFEELQRVYYRYTQHVTWQVLKRQEDAHDANQEVWKSIWKNLSKFQGKSRFSTWIYRIAYNKALDFRDRSKRLHAKHWSYHAHLQKQTLADAHEVRHTTEHMLALLDAVLEKSDPQHATAFRLKFEQDMTHKDIADHFGVSTATVWNWISSLRQELRKEFQHNA